MSLARLDAGDEKVAPAREEGLGHHCFFLSRRSIQDWDLLHLAGLHRDRRDR
jgi:hypothetical protein